MLLTMEHKCQDHKGPDLQRDVKSSALLQGMQYIFCHVRTGTPQLAVGSFKPYTSPMTKLRHFDDQGTARFVTFRRKYQDHKGPDLLLEKKPTAGQKPGPRRASCGAPNAINKAGDTCATRPRD